MRWAFLLLSCLSCFGQFTPDQATIGLSVRVLGSSASTTADDNQATAAYTPQIGSMLVAIVVNTKSALPDQPTVTGNSLVWTEIFDTNYSLGIDRLTVWQAKCGSGATPGAFTAATTGVNQTGWCVGVVEITGGVFTGTEGTNGILQRVNANTTITEAMTVTFGTLGKGTACILLATFDENATCTPEAGWTELLDVNFNTPACGIAAAYRLKNTDTTGTITSDGTVTAGCIVGLEFGQLGNFP